MPFWTFIYGQKINLKMFNIENFDKETQHGFAIKLEGHKGSLKSAENLAETLFKEGLASQKVERILNPLESIWVFIWGREVSVDMPKIIKTISQFPDGTRAVSIYNLIKENEGKSNE